MWMKRKITHADLQIQEEINLNAILYHRIKILKDVKESPFAIVLVNLQDDLVYVCVCVQHTYISKQTHSHAQVQEAKGLPPVLTS